MPSHSEKTKILNSPEETFEWAQDLAKKWPAHVVVLLEGDLGAGKTQFVRGYVKGFLGDDSLVSSPTYTLINSYEEGCGIVHHVDLYRLQGVDDLESVGFWDLLAREDEPILVEWAEKLAGQKLTRRKVIRIILTDLGGNKRQAQLAFEN